MDMGEKKEVENEEKDCQSEIGREEHERPTLDQAAAILRLIVLAATVTVAKGQDEDEGSEGWSFELMIAAYTIVVMMITALLCYILKGRVSQERDQSRSDQVSPDRSAPKMIAQRGAKLRKFKEKGSGSEECGDARGAAT